MSSTPHVEPVDGPDAVSDRELELRDRLLEALLPNVTFDGWTDVALRIAADSAGIDRQDARRLMPDPAHMVAHLSDWADRRMMAALAPIDRASVRTRDRVALGVRARLEALDGYEDAVRRAFVVLSMPQNLALATRLLYRTVDRVWRTVGDRSTDFNFYTKRGLLAGVVSAATLYWLDDTSPGKADTWRFLERRIDDVMRVGRGIGESLDPGRWTDLFASPLRLMRAVRRQTWGA